ncbi:hypothetical protein [Peribacillus frigoritolerans]|uniref:hypothetical protein n=1 Tax=Peribacillus castrilensis TaxID=2897690 RepID=UPI002DD31431|nr:hypothetical protein [Peribacillus castrilensis]
MVNHNKKMVKEEFDYEVETLIKKGKSTIQDISIIEGIYKDYVLLKSGYLASTLQVSDINLDLLEEYKQNRLFEDCSSFLMSQIHDQLQTISMTVPVDFRSYNLGWKKRYLYEWSYNGCLITLHTPALISISTISNSWRVDTE